MTLAAASSARTQSLRPEVLAEVRRSVRRILEATPAYAETNESERQSLAHKLVDVGLVAAGLLDEEQRISRKLAERNGTRRASPIATGQSAGDQLGLQAVRAAAPALTQARDSIDFPNFVGSLITGVFNAILHSSTQQIGQLGELVDGVSASAEDFANTVSDGEVIAWLVAKFPALLVAKDGGVDARAEVDLSEHAAELTAGLQLSDGGDPTDPDSLMDLGRLKMARDKQSTLATMMQLGMQRIVVDDGRIHASMDLRVDAQSGSQEARASRDDWRVNAGASGSFTAGLWGASASASTSVGQVKSDAQYTTEQLGLRAGIRSSVDLAFRTDQVPIDKLASRSARVKLEQAARVPADVSSGASIIAAGPANFSAPSLDVPSVPAAPPARPGAGQPSPTQAPKPQQSPQQRSPGQQPAASPRSPGEQRSPTQQSAQRPAAQRPTQQQPAHQQPAQNQPAQQQPAQQAPAQPSPNPSPEAGADFTMPGDGRAFV